ncbi:hypothetical protein BHM03_00056363 [Ensete ventricosum]|nr:hypothetical protein BHM03_00056363 [Ensete ventricosum]
MDAATARHGSKTPRWLVLSTCVSLLQQHWWVSLCSWHRRLPGEGASKKEEPTVEGIGRRGWLAAVGVEVLLHLGSSERRRCRLTAVGASATTVAATSDRLATAEVAGGEEQQLLQIWWKKVPTGASVRGREQRLWLATVIVGVGVDGSDRGRRPWLRSSGSDWELLLMEEKAAYAYNGKGGRRGSGQTAGWKEQSQRSDPVIVARDSDG